MKKQYSIEYLCMGLGRYEDAEGGKYIQRCVSAAGGDLGNCRICILT